MSYPSLLRNLLVTPSFIKNYRNPHLTAVCTEALRTLKSAARWVFIGHSLPADDYHVRFLLLRARAIHLERPARRTAGSQRRLGIEVIGFANPECLTEVDRAYEK